MFRKGNLSKRTLLMFSFGLTFSVLPSLADSTCKKLSVTEAFIPQLQSVIARPLSFQNRLWVVDSQGLVNVFNDKGEVVTSENLKDSVSIAPFELNSKVYIVGSKKVHILGNKGNIKSIDLPDFAISAGDAGNLFGVGFRSGSVAVYDSDGEKKYQVDGILPNDKFPSFHASGKEVVIIGQNSVKYVRDNSDIVFDKLISAGAGNGNQLALGDTSGGLYILDIAKKKYKTHTLGGGIDKIIATYKGGFLIATSSGKLFHWRSDDSKTPKELEIKVSTGGLYRNSESKQLFAFGETGEVYLFIDGQFTKTKVTGSFDNIFPRGKGFVTYKSGGLKIFDSNGEIIDQHNLEAGTFGISRIHQNLYLVGGASTRTVALGQGNCPDQK